ncbi:hypothetical protein BD626DRAFT_500953 [Schizophyllum amplum]|uniref:Uncharacterized protein n=1 Tax=Schizophyllum amplum TaxID=97359 RepID=A0A550C9E6_9AGAR|nr:hypothetical protein BD626DRAFT_500953 [Auriculariopsis ampla]
MSGPYPNTHHIHYSSGSQDDVKVGFDDLIDEYSTPYAANARHQTFAVNAPAMEQRGPEHRRAPSYPLSNKVTIAEPSKSMSDDTHDHSTIGAYPPITTVVEDTRPFWLKLVPESLACRLYLLTVLIETIVDLVIEGELYARMDVDDETSAAAKKMPVYLSIFAMAHVFQFAMAVDAVYARNTLQFIFLTVFNLALLVYSVIQISEMRGSVDVNQDGLAYITLGWKIYHEFGWKVYKFLGADRRIKKMYANYQIYECLVKFDVFFWAGFSVQFIWLVLSKDDWEYYVTCAALPLSIVLLVEGHLAARHENKWMMATFMSGCVGAMVYFVYKLTKVFMYKTEQFENIWKSLVIFSGGAIILLLFTFALSIVVMQNFGRGLKESLARRNNTHHTRAASKHHGRAASLNPNRMSID